MKHTIVDDELRLLGEVRTLLQEVPYEIPPKESDIVKELVRLREELPQAKEEDRGALLMQFDQQHALLNQLRKTRDRPTVDPDSPYFAHLRLREPKRTRDVFLGKATRIERGVRIVDWRNAPISRIFYSYQQDEEYEEELGGRTQVGVVEARRTLTIRRGELTRIDAPEGTFRHGEGDEWELVHTEPPRLAGGEGVCMRTYEAGEGGHRRMGTDHRGARQRVDKRLPDIAGLIDPEQFDLITRPRSGFVVIRGTAGSGKTTVALHRIAYLAYDDPRINTAATMFIVFSPALREYVQHVLPALGVPNAMVRDFRHWANEQRVRHFPRLPRPIRDNTPAVVIKMKLHPAMMEVLRQQVERVSGPPTAEQVIDDWISCLTDKQLLKDVFDEKAPNAFADSEFRRVATWSRDRFQEVIERMEGDKSIKAALDLEDEPILLHLWQLRCGRLRSKKKRPLIYRHIAVDEVQDFAPLEVQVLLGCLDKEMSITLAGDTQQHVMEDAGFTSWSEFFGHLGLTGSAVNTLKIAYRSTRQVVEFAIKLLGDLREDDSMPLVTRDGPEVELFQFTDHGACVAFLADALRELSANEPLASVVVLAPDQNVAGLYYLGLEQGEVPNLRRVHSHDFSFSPGVEVVDILSVKGLEFDYVILVETSAKHFPDSSVARRLLHVGATRAIHQLWLTCVGSLSPIVREAVS